MSGCTVDVCCASAAPLDMYMGTCTDNNRFEMPGYAIAREDVDDGATTVFKFTPLPPVTAAS